MQSEKARFEETVGVMSKQLMDFVEKMNDLEQECVSWTTNIFWYKFWFYSIWKGLLS